TKGVVRSAIPAELRCAAETIDGDGLVTLHLSFFASVERRAALSPAPEMFIHHRRGFTADSPFQDGPAAASLIWGV
ncbi:MAG: hypothetical protein KGP14_15235, partial [Betaproteobacteria bacterium]|nr:hypothetical protein [Betaproteobacteria bacterium]